MNQVVLHLLDIGKVVTLKSSACGFLGWEVGY